MNILDMTEHVSNLLDGVLGKDNEQDEAIIWRIEHPAHGDGPYHITFYRDEKARDKFPWMFKEDQKWYHPMPDTERGIKKRYAFMKKNSVFEDIFGFPDVEAYIKWFNKPSWRRSLENAGFRLVKYRARRVAMGETQCIFNRKESEKLAEYSPTAFDAEYAGRWEIR